MEPSVETTNNEDADGVFEDRLNDLITRLENQCKDLKTLASDTKIIKKDYTKIIKKMAGSRRKKVPKDPNAPKKAPSGFAKPTKISQELAQFLGVSEGELIARPEVTKRITAYVKEHNLQKEENKRNIDLTKAGGEALIKLLNIQKDAELTFFNLQKYLKIHFPVSEKAAKEAKEKPVKAAKKTSDSDAEVEPTDASTTGTAAPKSRAKRETTGTATESAKEEAPKAKTSRSKTTEAADSEEVPKEEAPVRRRRRAADETAAA